MKSIFSPPKSSPHKTIPLGYTLKSYLCYMNLDSLELVNPALARRVRQHVLGPTHNFRVICHPGFEEVTAQELSLLGITGEMLLDYGAVEIQGKLTDAWKINAFSRTATRVLMRIASFSAENFGKYEKELAKIPWELYLPSATGMLPEISVTSHTSRLYHSDALLERAQPIIAEALHESVITQAEGGDIPMLPSQTIFLRFEDDVCQVSIDLTGTLLYKRGLDRFVESAPIRDTMASAILFAGGILSMETLLDPMAGSGTFSLEAVLWSQGLCPAKTRSTDQGVGFALGDQPAFKPATWNHLVNKTEVPHPSSVMQIFSGDKNPKAFATLQHNIEAASMKDRVETKQGDFFDLPSQGWKYPTLLVLNPPYGKRIKTDAVSLYAEIGKKIAKDFREISVAVVVPNEACHRALHLNPTSQIRTSHGGIDVTVEFR